MQKVIQGRKLNQSEVNYILSLTINDINTDLLETLFANKEKTPAKFNPSDYFTLEKGKFKNTENIITTVGRYIFNIIVLDDIVGNYLSYMNVPMTQKELDKLESLMSKLLLEDKITAEQFADHIDKIVWLGFSISKYLNASLTTDMIIAPKAVTTRKEELKTKYAKELENGDISTVSNMENELLEIAKSEVKDLPDNDLYECGARGSFSNNYKNTSVMRGVIRSLADPNDILVSTASLEEGIPPEELYAYADILTQASASRAISTRQGGYENKKLSASLQSVMIDEKGTDCGTKLTMEVILTDKNFNLFKYRYMDINGKYILLTPDNKKDYLNKLVKFRSPLYCKSDKLCNKCAGELFYMLGINNIGLVSNNVASKIMNMALKAFHDMSIKLKEVDPENYISID